jgi:hypothetical protein
MGQAKQRGTYEDRTANALARSESLRPTKLDCKHCQAEITEIEQMAITGMAGVNAVYTGLCDCGHTSFAMIGEPQAVAKAMLLLDMQLDGDGIVGLEKL